VDVNSPYPPFLSLAIMLQPRSGIPSANCYVQVGAPGTARSRHRFISEEIYLAMCTFFEGIDMRNVGSPTAIVPPIPFRERLAAKAAFAKFRRSVQIENLPLSG